MGCRREGGREGESKSESKMELPAFETSHFPDGEIRPSAISEQRAIKIHRTRDAGEYRVQSGLATYKDIGDAAASVLGALPVGGLDVETEDASGVASETRHGSHLAAERVDGETRRILPAKNLVAYLPVYPFVRILGLCGCTSSQTRPSEYRDEILNRACESAKLDRFIRETTYDLTLPKLIRFRARAQLSDRSYVRLPLPNATPLVPLMPFCYIAINAMFPVP